VVGEGVDVAFPPERAVALSRRTWGEALGDDSGYDRIYVLAPGSVRADFDLLLQQMHRVLKNDGQLVIVAARPSPWGLRGSPWQKGLPARAWRRMLRTTGWLVAECATVGFSANWWRKVWPEAGVIRVIVAQKRIGGVRVLADNPQHHVVLRPVGVTP